MYVLFIPSVIAVVLIGAIQLKEQFVKPLGDGTR